TEKGTLCRAFEIKAGGKKVRTPTRALNLTRNSKVELDATKHLVGTKFTPFAEVFARVTPDVLSKIIDSDPTGQRFSSELNLRLNQSREAGAVPYLVLQLTNNDGSPYNQVPPKRILDLLFNLLWGTPGNSFVVPPLLGALQNESDYVGLFKMLKERIESRTERRELPLVGLVPSSYRLVAPRLIQGYWNLGCRLFAFDCENKKTAAFGYVLEKLHQELTPLSRGSREQYALHALNSKFRTGRGDTMRVNDLLSPGFGFDSYGPNHVTRFRWIPQRPLSPLQNNQLLSSTTYGFVPMEAVASGDASSDTPGLRTRALAATTRTELRQASAASARNLSVAHNAEVEMTEISKFTALVESGNLMKHYEGKPLVAEEVQVMRKVGARSLDTERQESLSEWFGGG
ncbi:MAG: hypothetical protein JRN38_07190, partial [Nitrososphaerota archaeon]|nr:hypothetical protein [Nitrososphaerota archaeon]